VLPPALVLVGSLVGAAPMDLNGQLEAYVQAPATKYEAALHELDAANDAVNDDPDENLARLADALAAMEPFPRQLANHADGARLVELATLNLARALLRAGDRARATEIMDELLRRSAGKQLPVQRFGPTLVGFHDARVAALTQAGTAGIEFECEVSCEILLDRREVTSRSGPLYLGTYVVEISSEDGSLPPERQVITLDEPGVVETIRYPMAGLELDDEAPAVIDVPRLVPRWGEVILTVVGAGMVGASAVLLALDGTCPGGGAPIDDMGNVCPNLYETTAVGATLLGFGSAVMTTGIVLLSVDEVQTRRGRRPQATLSWRVRF
jgi:hypothetical protein